MVRPSPLQRSSASCDAFLVEPVPCRATIADQPGGPLSRFQVPRAFEPALALQEDG